MGKPESGLPALQIELQSIYNKMRDEVPKMELFDQWEATLQRLLPDGCVKKLSMGGMSEIYDWPTRNKQIVIEENIEDGLIKVSVRGVS